jgi:hypothetical protein
MGAAKPQSRLAIVLALALARLATATAASADAAATAYPLPEGERLFAYDTALGRFEYVAGRGLRLGKTGFTVGGFATAGGEYLEGGDREAALEGVNLFLFFDPLAFVHVFSEIEIEQLATLERGAHGVRSDPEVEVDRLYLDVGKSDLLNVRFGKFLTPFGRWNQAPAEPLVWTTSEPVIVEEVFDEATTGAALWGTVFRGRGALSYALYGTFLDPIAPDREFRPADDALGARIEWASGQRWSLGTSYWASERSGRGWNHLGGLDALWRPHERLELSGEALAGEGSRENGGLWGVYAQAVYEIVPTLYAVGRYEHFDPPDTSQDVDSVALGLTWVPVHYVRVKADYLVVDHHNRFAAPGLRASFSILF